MTYLMPPELYDEPNEDDCPDCDGDDLCALHEPDWAEIAAAQEESRYGWRPEP